MPWKTQEIELEGAKAVMVLVDVSGNPIWIDEKGMEVGQDVVRLRSQIADANKEAADRRGEIKILNETIEKFKDLDPEAARQAIATVANLKDKEIVAAGQVEQIKKAAVDEVNKAWEAKYGSLEADYKTKLADFEGKVGSQDATIRRLMVKGAFDGSQFIKDAVAENYFPEVLYTMFGDRFEVRPAENGGDPVVVAKGFNNEEIYSPANPRQLASPEEAIEVLVRSHPHSAKILRGSQASGSGSQSGTPGGSRNPLQTMKDQYATAKKAGNISAMVALKGQIHAQDPTFTGD